MQNSVVENNNRIENAEAKIFTKWINIRLKQHGKSSIKNIYTDLSDGIVIFTLFQTGGHRNLPSITREAKLKIQKVDNLTKMFEFMKEQKIRLTNIDPMDIVGMNKKLILSLVWALIKYFSSIQEANMKDKEFRDTLLEWVISRIIPYEIEVDDFNTSFKDGRALCALLHSIDNSSIDYQKSMKLSDAERVKHAFAIAHSFFMIEDFLEVEDLTGEMQMNEKCIIAYIAEVHKAYIRREKKVYLEQKLKLMNANFEQYRYGMSYYGQIDQEYGKEIEQYHNTKADIEKRIRDLASDISGLSDIFIKIQDKMLIMKTILLLVQNFERIGDFQPSKQINENTVNENFEKMNEATFDFSNLVSLLNTGDTSSGEEFRELYNNLERYFRSISEDNLDLFALEKIRGLIGMNNPTPGLSDDLKVWINQMLGSATNLRRSIETASVKQAKARKFFDSHAIDGKISSEMVTSYVREFFLFPEEILEIKLDEQIDEIHFLKIVKLFSTEIVNREMLEELTNYFSKEDTNSQVKSVDLIDQLKNK